MITESDQALRDPELALVFKALRDAADGPAPVPSDALAAVLAGIAPITKLRDRNTARASIVALVAAGVVAAGVGAAAADQLPAPAQRAIASMVNHLTPFHLPEPRIEREAAPASPIKPGPARLPETTSLRPATEPTSPPVTRPRVHGPVAPAPGHGADSGGHRGSRSGPGDSGDSAPTPPQQSGTSGSGSGDGNGSTSGTGPSSGSTPETGGGGGTSGTGHSDGGSSAVPGDSATPGD